MNTHCFSVRKAIVWSPLSVPTPESDGKSVNMSTGPASLKAEGHEPPCCGVPMIFSGVPIYFILKKNAMGLCSRNPSCRKAPRLCYYQVRRPCTRRFQSKVPTWPLKLATQDSKRRGNNWTITSVRTSLSNRSKNSSVVTLPTGLQYEQGMQRGLSTGPWRKPWSQNPFHLRHLMML